jgi:hypothetical protein
VLKSFIAKFKFRFSDGCPLYDTACLKLAWKNAATALLLQKIFLSFHSQIRLLGKLPEGQAHFWGAASWQSVAATMSN